jgi:hypothetical protein
MTEVIEHLPREIQELTMREIHRILRSEGKFAMTTPNKHIYLFLTKTKIFSHNPEHVGELSMPEAQSLFARYFHIIDCCGKASSMNYGRFLDLIVPTRLRWNLLLVGEKVSRNAISAEN